MFESIPTFLQLAEAAATDPTLVTIYWACAVVGVGMILLSALGGAHGHGDVSGVGGDLPTDMHADFGGLHGDAGVDLSGHAGGLDHAAHGDAHLDGHAAHGGHHGGHATASSLATWFSVRFVVFFVGIFGVIGLVLTHMTGATAPVGFGVALLSGLVAGQGVHQSFRRLAKTAGDSTTVVADYVNQIGRVTIAIRPPKTGEVAIAVRGGERFIPAASKHADAAFAVGDEAAVVDYAGGIAGVVSRKEFEFVRQTGGETHATSSDADT